MADNISRRFGRCGFFSPPVEVWLLDPIANAITHHSDLQRIDCNGYELIVSVFSNWRESACLASKSAKRRHVVSYGNPGTPYQLSLKTRMHSTGASGL